MSRAHCCPVPLLCPCVCQCWGHTALCVQSIGRSGISLPACRPTCLWLTASASVRTRSLSRASRSTCHGSAWTHLDCPSSWHGESYWSPASVWSTPGWGGLCRSCPEAGSASAAAACSSVDQVRCCPLVAVRQRRPAAASLLSWLRRIPL